MIELTQHRRDCRCEECYECPRCEDYSELLWFVINELEQAEWGGLGTEDFKLLIKRLRGAV